MLRLNWINALKSGFSSKVSINILRLSISDRDLILYLICFDKKFIDFSRIKILYLRNQTVLVPGSTKGGVRTLTGQQTLQEAFCLQTAY